MRGPMLAQILGTFGLALLLRYTAFGYFGANVRALPDTLVGGTFEFGSIRIEASRLLAGVVALAVTAGLHLILTRTALGSRMLAVSEDRGGRRAHGHSSEPHAGDRLGARGRRNRHRRRADGDVLSVAPTIAETLVSSPLSRFRSAVSAACRARSSPGC